jgi:hypothetical protein
MYPTDAIMSGKKIPIRELDGASIDIKVNNANIERNKPSKATNCLRFISPLPILQMPGIY